VTDPLYEYLAAIDRSWQALVDEHRPSTRRVRIADKSVELAVLGDRLAELLLPPFECHPDTVEPAVATVGAWDAAALQVALPGRPPADDPLVRQWIVRRGTRPMAEVEWPSDHMVRIGNRYRNRHLLGVASTSVLSPWEAGAPLRRQLWWALGPDALFVHAGAVGDEHGVALIMGASGAGKSTTTLACASAGMQLLADDYCLVRGDPPIAHVLHATARVHEHELANLGGFAEPVSLGHDARMPDGEMKALLFPYRTAPHSFLRSAPVRVVLVLERALSRRPAVERVRTADALRAVAPSSLRQMHLEADRELAGLRGLLQAVPTYRLLLSPDRGANPEVVQRLLSSLPERE
jgi:hypothetical protein